VFVGNDAMFKESEGRNFAQVTDGLSNTIMTIEGGDPVIWTKPDDIAFDKDKELPKLELPGGIKEIAIGLADGSVRRISLDKVDKATLKAMITPSGGESFEWPSDNSAAAEARSIPAVPVAPTTKAEPPKD
jgi:hypothetical protein